MIARHNRGGPQIDYALPGSSRIGASTEDVAKAPELQRFPGPIPLAGITQDSEQSRLIRVNVCKQDDFSSLAGSSVIHRHVTGTSASWCRPFKSALRRMSWN